MNEQVWNSFQQIVESRRSIRKFLPEALPDKVVEQCLDMALLAPNSSNLQPWQFYWVKDTEKKKKLAECCLGQPAATTAATLIVCVSRIDTWKKTRTQMMDHFSKQPKAPSAVKKYYEKLVPIVYGQGPLGVYGPFKWLLTTVGGWFRPLPRGPYGHSGMRLWAHKTTALACENLMLAFSAAGYDTCPMEGFDEVRVKKLLNLPCEASVTMVISAGRRAPEGVYGPRIRFEKSQFVFEV